MSIDSDSDTSTGISNDGVSNDGDDDDNDGDEHDDDDKQIVTVTVGCRRAGRRGAVTCQVRWRSRRYCKTRKRRNGRKAKPGPENLFAAPSPTPISKTSTALAMPKRS